MIRKMTAALVPPTIGSINATNGFCTLTWAAVSNRTYRVQFKNSLDETNWADLPGDVTATNSTASKTDVLGDTTRFYRLIAR
jgi:hypothetical protein